MLMAGPALDLSALYIIDSGCSQSASQHEGDFVDLRRFIGSEVKGIGGQMVTPHGVGTMRLACNVDGNRKVLYISNVLYIPRLGVNLLSATQLLDLNVTFSLRKTGCSFQAKGVTFTATRTHGLFALDVWKPSVALNAYSVPNVPIKQYWHARMGHLGQQNVDKLPSIVTGVDFSHEIAVECTCESCVMGRHKTTPHKHRVEPGKYPMDLIHSDIVGPITPIGFNGAKYFITWRDDDTKFADVDTMKNRSECFESFKRFKARRERGDRKIHRLRIDNAKEYIKGAFAIFLKDEGIVCEPTVAGNPEQNGEAERFGQTLLRRMHPMLVSSGLSRELWPEVVQTANYLIARSPATGLGITPIEAFTSRRPDLSHLRTIGSRAWAMNRIQKKLKDRSERCYLVGYDGESIYRLWNAVTKEVIRSSSCHIQEKRPRFISDWEECLPNRLENSPMNSNGKRPQQLTSGENKKLKPVTVNADVIHVDASLRPMTRSQTARRTVASTPDSYTPSVTTPTESTSDILEGESSIPLSPSVENQHLDVLRSHQDSNLTLPDDRDLSSDPIALLSMAAPNEPYEPKTYAEAMRDKYHRMDWQVAMKEEHKSLMDNKTWTLTDLPAGKTALTGRWVYTLKRGPKAGEILRYKARWVVRGFQQREGLDYHETFASVVKPMSYKAIFALAAALDWDIEQMDVKTAFLYGAIEEELYMEQPTGMTDGSPRVCRLKRALYGLKQSPRVWYETLTKFLRSLGFTPINADFSVFINYETKIIIAIYVDDLLIVGANRNAIKAIKAKLNKRFEMKDLGPCAFYLGMVISRDRANRTLCLSQAGYVEQVLRRFDMWESKPQLTPMDASTKLHKADEGYIAPADFRLRYQSAVGSLMYAMLGTRPDIAYAVSVVSRYGSNPTDQHWAAVKRIFRYLKGTVSLRLTFKGPLHQVSGYADADWAGDQDTRRSTSGYVFNVGSGAISWSSKRQPTVALSTCEAEYIGQTQATKEAIWLRNLLTQLSSESPNSVQAVVIYCDNQGAIALAKNPQFHSRTKHIDINQHFVREKVADGKVTLEYVPTEEQIADGLTKALSKDKFNTFRRALGLEL